MKIVQIMKLFSSSSVILGHKYFFWHSIQTPITSALDSSGIKPVLLITMSAIFSKIGSLQSLILPHFRQELNAYEDPGGDQFLFLLGGAILGSILLLSKHE